MLKDYYFKMKKISSFQKVRLWLNINLWQATNQPYALNILRNQSRTLFTYGHEIIIPHWIIQDWLFPSRLIDFILFEMTLEKALNVVRLKSFWLIPSISHSKTFRCLWLVFIKVLCKIFNGTKNYLFQSLLETTFCFQNFSIVFSLYKRLY